MDRLTDVLFTVAICVAFATMMWTNNKRFEILECKLQVQTARIDLLNGLEITRPECLDELMGPAKEPVKKPAKHV